MDAVLDRLVGIFGPLAFNLTQILGGIIYVAIIFAVAGLFLVRWQEARLLRRYQAGMGRRRSGVAARTLRARARKRAEDEEFVAVIGMAPGAHMIRSLVIALMVSAVLFLLLRSWGLSVVILIGVFMWRNGRARGVVEKVRNKSLSEELLPAANEIANSIVQGMSLSESLATLTRAGNEQTLFVRSLRRAMASANGLEAGLRAEYEIAKVDVAREFFEILADGAGTHRKRSATAEILTQFVDANQRLQNAWQKANSYTAQARGSRTLMLVIIPGLLAVSALRVGFDVFFQTNGGNLVIIIISTLLLAAIIITNGAIRGAMKDF